MVLNQIRECFDDNSLSGEILVKTPYFNFPLNLRSVDRNCRFKIITCGLNSNSFIQNGNLKGVIPFIYRSIHNLILWCFDPNNKISIYHYANKFLHSKSIIFKENLIIGSSNFNLRSFGRDVEIDFLLLNPSEQLLGYCSQNVDKTLKLTKRKPIFLDFLISFFKKYF